MKIIIITEDGREQIFDSGDSIRNMMEYIKRNDVEVVVVGEIDGGKVVWEKQFKPATVMPASFGQA